MSQAGINNTSAIPIPPTVPTSFVTDVRDNTTTGPGTAIPAANVLQVLGKSTDQNNSNGIRTDANPNNGNIVYTELTNRFQLNTTTTGAATSTVTILSALAAGTYTFDIMVAGFATLGPAAGNGYTIVGAVRSTGAAATLLPNQQKDSFEETVGANAILDVSANTAIVTVTGVAANNFDWNITGTYILVS